MKRRRRLHLPRAGVFRRQFAARGSTPGEMTRDAQALPPKVFVISFGADEIEDRIGRPREDYSALVRPDRVLWVDVQGLGDPDLIRRLGEQFGLHPLAVADIAHVGQRPKVDDYGSRLAWFIRMLTIDEDRQASWEQVSVIQGERFVLTFQETYRDCLTPLRERIRQRKGVVRTSGADHLAVMVVDAIVDGYFPALEMFGDQLAELELRVIGTPGREDLEQTYGIRRQLMDLRRATWPLRDTLNRVLRDRHPMIGEKVLPYLHDAADHVMQTVDVLESYRELSASFVEVYLSSLSQRANETMRVLTVIATIFIPLTFIAGVYGMNFAHNSEWNMPELTWKYGYVFFWALCAVISILMLAVFAKLGWIGFGRKK